VDTGADVVLTDDSELTVQLSRHLMTTQVLHHLTHTHIHSTVHTYTVSHKKRVTSFWTITPTFLGGFLLFLYQWKQE